MDLQTYLTKSYLRPNRQVLQGLGATDEQIRYIMETPGNFNWGVWSSVSGSESGTNKVVLAVFNNLERVEEEGQVLYVGDSSYYLNNGDILAQKAFITPTDYNIYVNNIQLTYKHSDSHSVVYGDGDGSLEDVHIGVSLRPTRNPTISCIVINTLDIDLPVTISIEEKNPITLPHTVHLVDTNMLDDSLSDEEYEQIYNQNCKEILDLQEIYSKFGNGTIGNLTIEGVDNFIVARQQTLVDNNHMDLLLDEANNGRSIKIEVDAAGTIQLYSNDSTTDLENITLTIESTPGYVISNDAVSTYVKQGDTFTFPTGDSKRYYMANGQRYEPGQTITPTSDLTYTMHSENDNMEV